VLLLMMNVLFFQKRQAPCQSAAEACDPSPAPLIFKAPTPINLYMHCNVMTHTMMTAAAAAACSGLIQKRQAPSQSAAEACDPSPAPLISQTPTPTNLYMHFILMTHTVMTAAAAACSSPIQKRQAPCQTAAEACVPSPAPTSLSLKYHPAAPNSSSSSAIFVINHNVCC
jgi:hypothetical protein